MESRNNARPVVEAGMLSALIIVMVILVQFVPLLGLIGFLVLPIPVAVLYIRHNFKLAVTSVVASILISCVVIGVAGGISYGIQYGFVGMALGYCFKKGIKESKSLLILTIFSLLGVLLTVVLYFLITNKNIMIETLSMFSDTLKQTLQQYGNVGGTQVSTDLLASFSLQSLIALIPGILVVSSFLLAFINFIVTRSILKRLGFEVVELVPFERVYIDNRIGALLIVASLLGLTLQSRNMLAGRYLYNSVMILMYYTFTVTGAALVYFFLKNKLNIRKGSAVFMTIVAVLIGSSGMFIPILGFADLIMDFRKVDPNRLFKSRSR
ncbi:MAG: YybS family protein [Bacillota bacterium]|nr:YybS family protein [Bacillota bacterium]